MYCPNCGEKAKYGDENCTKCGHPLSLRILVNEKSASSVPGAITVSIHIENVSHDQVPWVLWLDPEKGALISITENHNQSIDCCDVPQAGDADHFFRSYAKGLVTFPLEKVMEAHPGSILFDTEETRMVVYISYPSDFDRIDDYERFILETPAGKYRGGFERGAHMTEVKSRLGSLLGDCYITKAMEKFPSE